MIRIAAFVGAAMLGTAAQAGSGAGLVSHVADYTLRLTQARDGSGIVDARGGIAYRFERVCDGWVSENRTYLTLRNAEGRRFDTAYVYTAWESFDGRQFRFRIRDLRDGEITEQSIGSARQGSPPEADFSAPGAVQLALPDGALFPTAHLEALLRAAREGRRFVSLPVFDGSASQPVNQVAAVINPNRKSVDTPVEGVGDEPFWRMRLAFYPLPEQPNAAPDYELTIDYGASGIAQGVVQDYGDFQITGTLKRVERLAAPQC